MPKLRLPDLRRLSPDRVPAALWSERPAPPAEVAVESVVMLLGRRQFLKALGVLLAALATPLTRVERAMASARGRFLTRTERATLEALCDRIIPPDADPGARALGAVTYIDRMLSAFDHRVPLVFAGGPFSNRNPFPDNRTGTASHRHPPDYLRRFIRPTRVQEIRWRAEIFGSAAVAGAAFNDAALGPLKGLRDIYREGLAKVDQMAQKLKGSPFARLSAGDQDAVLAAVDTPTFLLDQRRGLTFIDIVIQNTLEGCFALPEYGGNNRSRGWQMIGLEGDDQPLGYSIFSTAKNGYEERPDHPMSTPNPDEVGPNGAVVPKPLTADGAHIQASIVMLTSLFGE